jgi:hypothetical protein
MPNRLNHQPGAGINAVGFTAATSAQSGTEYDVGTVLSDWSLQVVAPSTDVVVTLDLTVQATSGATFFSALEWAASCGLATGDIVSLADTPARQVRATLSAGASSNAASAWIAGK